MNPIQYITPLDKKSYSIAYDVMYDYLGKEAIFNDLWVKSKSRPKDDNLWTGIRGVMTQHGVVIEIDRSTRNVKITVTLNAHE